jgi:hypothetical protein
MNILELYKSLGLEPRRIGVVRGKGEEWHGPCPCDAASEDRFVLWPEQAGGYGTFWCRGCRKGGNGVRFLMEFKGMGIKEALSYLGISKKGSEGRGKRPLFDSLKVASELVKPAAKALQVPAGVEDWARWREKACKFAHLCWDHLRNGNTEAAKNARAWLRNRGVTDETMDACLLGLHEQPGRRPAFRQKASWGIACPSEESSVFMLPYGIVIPNLSANGEVVSLRIRRSPADTNGSKYHLVKGSLNKSLVLPSTVSDCDVAVVVESELDAMAVWSAARDICHSIAIGSLSAKPSEDAWEVLKRCRAVLVSLDNDKTPAGNCTEGVLRALEEWKGMLFPSAASWPL